MWVVIVLIGIGLFLWAMAFNKAGAMFTALPAVGKFGFVIVALLGCILLALIAMLSRG